MNKQDFVSAHLWPLNLYRPLVSSVFHFTLSYYAFPEVNEELMGYFRLFHIISIA